MSKYVIYAAPHTYVERSPLAGQDISEFFYAEMKTLPILFAAREREGVLLPVFSSRELLKKFYEELGFGYDKIVSKPADSFLKNLPRVTSRAKIDICLDAGVKAHAIAALPIARPDFVPPVDHRIRESFEHGQGWSRTVPDSAFSQLPDFSGQGAIVETFEDGQGWSRTVPDSRFDDLPVFDGPDIFEDFDEGSEWGGTEPVVLGCEAFESGDVTNMYSGSLTLSSNGDIAALAGHDGMTGSLTVANGVTSLAGLESLRYIGGNLSIRSNVLPTLTGLDNLATVHGGLVIDDASQLTSVAGLNRLHSVGMNGNVPSGMGGLELADLPALTDMEGAFPCLLACDAIEFDSVGLTTLKDAFPHLETARYIQVAFMDDLTTMEGAFPLLVNMVGPFTSHLFINFLPALTTMAGAFASLERAGNLRIRNTALSNIDGLAALTTLAGDNGGPGFETAAQLLIKNNPNLLNLDSLSGITWISGSIDIEGNAVLEDVAGLLNVDGGLFVGDPELQSVVIADNPMLPENSQAQALIDNLVSEGFAGSTFNSGNLAEASPVNVTLTDSFEIAEGWANPPPVINETLNDSFEISDGWAAATDVTFDESFEVAGGWANPPPVINVSFSDSFEIADGWAQEPPPDVVEDFEHGSGWPGTIANPFPLPSWGEPDLVETFDEYSGWPGSSSDPYYSSVVMQMLFADASDPWKDTSLLGHVHSSKSRVLHNQSSAALVGGGGAAGIRYDTPPFNLSGVDWCIEFEVTFNRVDTTQCIVSHHAPGTAIAWQIAIDSATSYKMTLYNQGMGYAITDPNPPVAGVPVKYAFTKTSAGTNLYRDGIRVATAGAININPGTIALGIAGDSDRSTYGLNGRLRLLRVTKGVARYTGTSYDLALGPQVEVTPAPPPPMPADLVQYYGLNGNLLDHVGTRHLTHVSTPVYVPGKNGSALQISSPSAIASAPTVGSADGISVFAWVNIAEFQLNTGIATCGNLGETQGDWWLGFHYHFSAMRLKATINNASVHIGEIEITTGVHLVGFTYNRTHIKLYIDGFEVASSPQTAPLATTSSTLWLGTYYAPSQYFKGDLDTVMLWNRGLTLSEVEDLFNGGDGIFL